MKNTLVCASFGLAMLAAATRAAAAVTIVHPWIPAPPMGASTASGFVTLENSGRMEETFVGGSTPAADALQIHAMSMAGGVMRMRRMAGGLPLPPQGRVILSPDGGYHLMLLGLKRSLKAGDQVPVTLQFSRAGRIRVLFRVEGPASSAGR